jgi:outer membrane lipoprotein SlyB
VSAAQLDATAQWTPLMAAVRVDLGRNRRFARYASRATIYKLKRWLVAIGGNLRTRGTIRSERFAMSYPSASPRRLHPLVATAAAAIIIASLTATAAITGLFPKASSNGKQDNQTQSAQVTNQPIVVDSAARAPAPAIALQKPTAPSQYSQVQQAPMQPTTPAVLPAGQTQYAAQTAPGPYTQQPAGQQPYSDQPSYAAQQQPYSAPPPQTRAAACASCGIVESVATIRRQGHGTGIGAVGGAVAGGVLGNQFGRGTGRAAMTVLGAVGGGFAGNAVEKRVRSETDYQVRVRMENGRLRYFTYHQPPPFAQGQPVRIEHGTLAAR